MPMLCVLMFVSIGMDEACIFERLDSEDALKDAFGAAPGSLALSPTDYSMFKHCLQANSQSIDGVCVGVCVYMHVQCNIVCRLRF